MTWLLLSISDWRLFGLIPIICFAILRKTILDDRQKNPVAEKRHQKLLYCAAIATAALTIMLLTAAASAHTASSDNLVFVQLMPAWYFAGGYFLALAGVVKWFHPQNKLDRKNDLNAFLLWVGALILVIIP